MSRHNLSEYDETRKYNDDDIFVLDDRGIKYDEETGEIVRPGDPRYDKLPELIRN